MNNIVSTMTFKLTFILTILILKSMFTNSILSGTPFFEDDIFEQSIVTKPMEGAENEFQLEMAHLLGLTERPKSIEKTISLKKAASKYLLELYDSLKEEEEPHSSAHNYRFRRSTIISENDRSEIEKSNNIITFSSKKGRSSLLSGMAISFNTNNVPEDLRLFRAELKIFQNPKQGRQFENENNVTVSIFRRTFDRILQKDDFKLISSFTTTTSYKGWLEANVTYTMSKWLSGDYNQYEHDLIVSTRLTNNEALKKDQGPLTPKDIGLIDVDETEDLQPFIIGYFNGPDLLNKIQHLRLKRDLGKRKMYSSENKAQTDRGGSGENYKLPKNCERMNFSIDFRDLQMHDWVIAPKKFEAYFCGGDCNFPLGSDATNHAIVQTLMHLKQPNLPKPCCVPTVLGSISLLHYINEDSVNLSKYPNSVAKSCGCH